MEIILQMRDRLFMREYGLAYEIIDRDNAAERPILKNGQIADVLVRHQLHAEFHRVLWCDRWKIF